ncbi:MAG: hypothetical protein OH338_05500 [Candidatus Parvarchaeota archaeon]|jgi:hypothetical protein|nr:hypothetical protein [Candidatus Parvarchaeota archaeon]MCW1295525.1 hypothetical protein [Candidatus Parvarchaeum tengchongense]MCW1298797.1 hypothetical protein [Candidatus Parvarchaeum tengchongense]MCW1312851.1 hypothetical protein [Candidatus Parvarchaeum tengchongense]
MAKGQSALEYMMTYGWAILIIVIVAVILYSMGIFNPRASVTATSSGFAPFTVSSTVCTPSYLAVAFSVGPLPGGATSAKVTGLTLSSPTGLNFSGAKSVTTATGTFPTVTTGTSFVINATNVGCTGSGIAFSAPGNLSFSVKNSAGTATYYATGTLVGTGSS